MHPVTVFDIIFFLSCIAGLIGLLKGWKTRFRTSTKLLLVGLLLFNMAYSFCMALEWAGITAALDPIEDFVGVLLPMWWAFAFYSIAQEIGNRDLIESERRHRELVEGTNCLVAQIDDDGVFVFVNHAANEILGIPPKACIGLSSFDFVHPEDRDKTKRAFAGWLKKKDSHITFENRLISRTGEIRHILWTINLHHDNGVPSMISFGRDITERIRAEQARNDLNTELEEKNKELESILYAVSHDLKTPLVNIQGFSYELAQSCNMIREAMTEKRKTPDMEKAVDTALNEEIPNALDFILPSTTKMDSLLDGILDLSRVNTAEANIKTIDMDAMVSGIIANMVQQIKGSAAEISIESLPPCRGDAAQINRVFTNLISNALKFLERPCPGRVRISGEKNREKSIYCIEDNGIGIADEHQEKIFEIFYQLEPEKDEGDGIGLAIVRRIVERHSGKIWVESKVGMGSKFFVSLPNV